MTLSSGQSEVLESYGLHSYEAGAILARLADYWSIVYEYTQKRHYSELQNWINSSDNLRVNNDRPFIERRNLLIKNLLNAYHEESKTYLEFIEDNWTKKR